ncbi:MAG: histone deacetylase [Candidatus Latescibacteria bacterium]|nr:histone deacetylase [Candidatus Latescibacterota bacterium]
MGQTAFYHHPAGLAHDSGPGHPECPQRLEYLVAEINRRGLDKDLLMRRPEEAPVASLERNHERAYIAQMAALSKRGHLVPQTPDTVVSPATYQAARLASGAVCEAIDGVLSGAVDQAFCANRPPGHHAEFDQAMGFCYFNHVAVGARHALEAGLDRVAIVDWDVHHGNGTQHSFAEDPRVFFFSVHQFPHYPGTGAADEKGRGPGQGTTLNAPVPAGTDIAEYRRIFTRLLAPALDQFQPDMILLSAGFDAHAADPLGGVELTEKDFAELTVLLGTMAQKLCQSRLVSVLEGGYDWPSTAQSAATHIEGLLAMD